MNKFLDILDITLHKMRFACETGENTSLCFINTIVSLYEGICKIYNLAVLENDEYNEIIDEDEYKKQIEDLIKFYIVCDNHCTIKECYDTYLSSHRTIIKQMYNDLNKDYNDMKKVFLIFSIATKDMCENAKSYNCCEEIRPYLDKIILSKEKEIKKINSTI